MVLQPELTWYKCFGTKTRQSTFTEQLTVSIDMTDFKHCRHETTKEIRKLTKFLNLNIGTTP